MYFLVLLLSLFLSRLTLGQPLTKTDSQCGPRNVEWISVSNGQMPPGAVVGGIDFNDGLIYIGRLFYAGDLLPMKVSGGTAYTPDSSGKEVSFSSYEVLVAYSHLNWVFGHGGSVPENAVKGGVSSVGETLYIGRIMFGGSLTIGKVHPSRRRLFITWWGKEYSFESYEVLVHDTC